MTKASGYIVAIGDIEGFCSTLDRALTLGRFLCSIYKKDSFTVTLTNTGDRATFSKYFSTSCESQEQNIRRQIEKNTDVTA